MSRKLGKNARKPVWINKELLAKLKHRRSIQRVKARTRIGKNTEMLSEHAGMTLGKPKPSWD